MQKGSSFKKQMHKNLPYQILLFFLVGLVLVIVNMDSMWSHSVDLAHHYALSFRILENGSLLTGNDPTLGEMNIYPKISHALAAISGLFFNSTFSGIQFVSLMSIALLWGSVIFIFNSLPLRAACISSIGLLCLLTANHGYFHFDIYGAEVVNNFFFPQLVAQAIALLALVIALYLEIKKTHPLYNYCFLTGMILIASGIHLVPAIELLGVLFGAVAIDSYLLYKHENQRRLQMMHLGYLAVISSATALFFFNPSFTVMRKLSNHNGGFILPHISSTFDLIILCFSVLAASGLLLVIWNKHKNDSLSYLAMKYLGLYGGSIALICLMQIVVLNFGYGSEYATKKYAFGLVSQLFISIPALAGYFLNNVSIDVFFDSLFGKKGIRLATVLLTFSAVFLVSISHAKILDTSDVVSFERRLLALRDVSLPVSNHKRNVVTNLENMPPTINYMFSIAIMKTPRTIATPDFVSSQLGDLNHYNIILTSMEAKPYYRSACSLPLPAGSIALLDAACVREALNSNCSGGFDFSSKGWVDRSMISGFSYPENRGRWTNGVNSKFSCIVKDKVPTRIKIHAKPFLYGRHDTQRLIIKIKSSVNQYIFHNTSDWQNIEIDLPHTQVNEKMTIEFNTPDAIVPKQLGYFNQDSRQLGFSIKSINFE